MEQEIKTAVVDKTALIWKTEEEAALMFSQRTELPADAQEKIDNLASGIAFDSTNQLSTFGADSQTLSYISDESLRHAQTKTIGEAGEALVQLNKDLKLRKDKLDKLQKDTKSPILSKLFGIAKRAKDRTEEIMSMNKTASENINKAVDLLHSHVVILRSDIDSMDKLLIFADQYTRELQMYILAGKKRYQQETDTTLKGLIEKAKETNDPNDAAAVNAFKGKLSVLADTISSLEFAYSAMVSNIGPCILLTQNNDLVLCNNIERTIAISKPLWATSLAVAIGQEHTEMSLNAAQASREFTSSLLKQNAEKLGAMTVEVAKERQEGIFNIDDLIESTNKLIQYVEEAHNIELESEKKRIENEHKLAANNTNVRNMFLKISTPVELK